MHIPLQEYMFMVRDKAFGQMHDVTSCGAINTGMFSVFKQQNTMGNMHFIIKIINIIGVFCGHDHNNDFHGDYFGIKLFFGRKTGYGGYGPV